MVRSAANSDGTPLPEVQSEIDYPQLLNRVLPRDIKVLGWTPVADDFHARYSAQFREYKYYIAGASHLDIPGMQMAAKAVEGVHDFSNLCRMNLDNSTQHVRSISFSDVSVSSDNPDMVVYTVRGKAFIWHQVRCLVAILMMVGQRLEAPSIMEALLDIEKNPGKPQYQMASEIPLLLHRTGFDRELTFFNSPEAAAPLLHDIAVQKTDLLERLALVTTLHERVREACARHDPAALRLDPPHIPLMKRGTDPSFAERLLAFQHKKGRATHAAT